MCDNHLACRCLSSLKSEREKASSILKGPSETRYSGDKKAFVESIRQVIQALINPEQLISMASFAGVVREQDRVVRAGLHAAQAGCQGVRVEPQLRRHCPHVEGRLYHQEQVACFLSRTAFFFFYILQKIPGQHHF